MLIGDVKENEKKISFKLDVKCNNCGKQVPDGMKTSENYFGTYSFMLEIDDLKKNYLCGKCRDQKRINQ